MSSMFNQLEKLKYTLDNENNTLNGQALDLFVKYFECRDNDIIDKLLQMNEEKEKKMRNETIFHANRDKIPKLNFETDNFEEWLYVVKTCIRKTTYYNYFEKKDIIIEKNYENELYDIMEQSIEEETKKQIQLDLANKNPRKLLKEIYHKTDDIYQHLEIMFMLFDELTKLKKNFTEQEKLEKIFNSLPEDYTSNIKKLTHQSQQLGLNVLYIIKYVEIWNKKQNNGITRQFHKSINEDNPFLYSSQYLNSTSFIDTDMFDEPEEIDNNSNGSDNDNENNNDDDNYNNDLVGKINQQDVKEFTNIKKSQFKEGEKVSEDTDDSKTLIHDEESSSSEENDDVSMGNMSNEKDINFNIESKKEIEKQSLFKRIFSLEHLFTYFILLLLIEGIIFLKFDISKFFN
ncbi:hypothetical protein BCR36DRAFT_345170 [Piromyces finnis]|uniref:Uncharacterized protein n=1 Tax=Piromyces finnis TaxID=1754191 RepID=A0A1Y1VIG5_9FUNG|nr:hypothetical protein BCR36DRAFT_345170 [Piromyces finnis]|eukprot:ORX57197.1 hypothetical protein BCR36DRAFT_345170 [Piromyces finnis]